jgi:hypothetical protein
VKINLSATSDRDELRAKLAELRGLKRELWGLVFQLVFMVASLSLCVYAFWLYHKARVPEATFMLLLSLGAWPNK